MFTQILKDLIMRATVVIEEEEEVVVSMEEVEAVDVLVMFHTSKKGREKQ